MSLFTDMVFWLINYWRHANMKPLYWLKALYCLHFEWISHVIKHPTLSHNSYSNGFFTWWPAASVTCLSSFLVSRDNKCSDLILFKDLKLCVLKSCFIYLFGCFFYQLFKYVYLFIYPCRADRRYLIKWTLYGCREWGSSYVMSLRLMKVSRTHSKLLKKRSSITHPQDIGRLSKTSFQ